MSAHRLEFVKTFVGKEFTASPSPYSHWLKGVLKHIDQNSLSVDYLVRQDMTNPMGILHGGVISGMIDDCMGLLLFMQPIENFCPTIGLNVDFFASAPQGETVTVKVQIVKLGKTIVNIRGEVFNKDGKLLAQSTSNCAFSSVKIPF